MTEKPSSVRIVTVLPPVGTVPAKETVPPAGASTGVPVGEPISIPRCCPAAYGSDPNEKGRRTGPRTGQLQAQLEVGETSAARAAHASSRILSPSFVARNANIDARVAAALVVVKSGYKDER